MLKELIGKDVIMIVGFANGELSGGACPSRFEGKVLDVTDEFVKIDVTDSSVIEKQTMLGFSYRKGACYINVQYIISVFEK